ncbi:MAG TPA: zinc ribbon domain-containing protein, partial [Thermomicrobiales bacterium]|nr:zinc ribbon domain-containing protein [Thermomicrobiales bacterium]
MLELAARAAQILVALGGAYLLALWFVLIVWTYRDIEARSGSVVTQVFSTLLVVLFFVPGVLLYLLLRPKDTLDQAFQRSLEEEYLLQDLEDLPHCPTCHRNVADDFMLCPHCHTQLRQPCSSCARPVDVRWNVCPYCAAPQHGQPEAAPRVEAPAARWIAPTARRRRLPESERGQLAAASGALTTQSAAAATANPDAGSQQASRGVVRPLDRFRGRFTTQPADGGEPPTSLASPPTSPLPPSLGSE